MGFVLKKNKESKAWILDSGEWCEASTIGGYVLSNFSSATELTETKFQLFQQMYHPWVDTVTGEVHPPEFKYHPETGKPLEKAQDFNANDVWIAPYGQSIFIENQNRKDNGLQYSRELKGFVAQIDER